MPGLNDSLNEALHQIVAEQRLTVLGSPPPVEFDDPASVVSGMPFVHFDAATDAFHGRRRRLTIRRGRRWVALLARSRPLPREPAGGWLTVQWGRDRANRPVAVSATDASSRAVHVLLDLATADVVGAPKCLDPLELLAETFIGEPLSILLGQAPEPRVGAEVSRRVRDLLEKRATHDRGALEKELSVLKHLAPRRTLPQVLLRRVELLKRALRGSKRTIDDQRIDLEVSRLVQLVRSRAVAAIRLGPTRIEGLMNPGPREGELRLCAAMFRLQLGFSSFHPILQTWSPTRPSPRGCTGHCLGEAQSVFLAQDGDGDLYSLIDTVINFRETNHIRTVRATRPGLRVSDALASMF